MCATLDASTRRGTAASAVASPTRVHPATTRIASRMTFAKSRHSSFSRGRLAVSAAIAASAAVCVAGGSWWNRNAINAAAACVARIATATPSSSVKTPSSPYSVEYPRRAAPARGAIHASHAENASRRVASADETGDALDTTRDARLRRSVSPAAARASAGHVALEAFFASDATAEAATTEAATTETMDGRHAGATPESASIIASLRRRASDAASGENESCPPSSAAAAHRDHAHRSTASESNRDASPRPTCVSNPRAATTAFGSPTLSSSSSSSSSAKSIFLTGDGGTFAATETYPAGLAAATKSATWPRHMARACTDGAARPLPPLVDDADGGA